MCTTRTRAAITSPNVQITRLVATSLPHWWLSTEIRFGAASNKQLMAKFVGFQRWLPRYCNTYFDAMARKPPSTNGQSVAPCGLSRSVRLMPLM